MLDVDFFKQLSQADGIAGNEQEVRQVLKSQLEDYADEIQFDGLGSMICTKKAKPGAPKIMLAAHIDEIGFMVRHIADGGQLILKPIGGVKDLAKFMQHARVTTAAGTKIYGILQSTAEKACDANFPGKTYLDIGATSAEEALSLGIAIGDKVCYASHFEEMALKNLVYGKAFDDRIGAFVLGSVLKRLKGVTCPAELYFAFTSSEEVGLRGAKTAAAKINPDVAFVVDAACYKDEFVRNYENKRQIGQGIILTHADKTYNPNRRIINFITQTALLLGKNIQHDMFDRGGTDAGEIHKNGFGVPTAVICLPLRYGHCAYSIAHLRDVEDAIDIFEKIALTFGQADMDRLWSF